jgi:hypothetical protein
MRRDVRTRLTAAASQLLFGMIEPRKRCEAITAILWLLRMYHEGVYAKPSTDSFGLYFITSVLPDDF